MGVLLEDQESESRRLGPWLELPQSPPRSVWAAVVAAWVSCCLRCRRLAQAGCAVDGVGSFAACAAPRSEEHTSELQSQSNLVCRLLLEKKKNNRACHLFTT